MSFTTFNDLIDALEADALLTSPQYKVDGVIWVANSYVGNDNALIELDGNTLTNISSNNLTITGGWVGVSGSSVASGVSSIDVSMSINNWVGNVTLQNLFISNVTDSFGVSLYVETDGNVNLDNIDASNATHGNIGIVIDKSNNVVINNTTASNNDGGGLWVTSSGDVTIDSATFNKNDYGGGLGIESTGNVTVNNVKASDNFLYDGISGAIIDTCLYSNTTGLCDGTGTVNITNSSFNNNGADGLIVDSGGNATLDTINAWYNWGHAVTIYAYDDNGAENVSVTNSDFYYNEGNGLNIDSDGSIFLNDINSDYNYLGMELYTSKGNGGITLSNVITRYNLDEGIYAESGSFIYGNQINASSNVWVGSLLYAVGDVNIVGSTFNQNEGGLYIKSTGNVLLRDNMFSDNASNGVWVVNP